MSSSRAELKAKSKKRQMKRHLKGLRKKPEKQKSSLTSVSSTPFLFKKVDKKENSEDYDDDNIAKEEISKRRKLGDPSVYRSSVIGNLNRLSESEDNINIHLKDKGSRKPIKKDFWIGEPGQTNSTVDLKIKRKLLGVNVKGNDLAACPPPIDNIQDPSLPTEFGVICKSLHIMHPTPVQQQCWPAILHGANILGVAPTGSGKTLAFCLPMIPHVKNQILELNLKSSKNNLNSKLLRSPISLILVPTRELAMQIQSVFKSIRRVSDLNCGIVYGGVDREEQLSDLTKNGQLHVLVGTPGRIIDYIQQNQLELDFVSYFVVDEADRMLAMGFFEQIDFISQRIRSDRQTCLFSATFPGKLRELANVWVQDAIIIRCSTLDNNVQEDVDQEKSGIPPIEPDSIVNSTENNVHSTSITINKNIQQIVHVCASHKKPRLLLHFIHTVREEEKSQQLRQLGSMLIFCNKIKTVSFVWDFLKRQNISCEMLHGQLNQTIRETVLQSFKSGKHNILICTDVAARGIHIKKLKYVVNYDFPSNIEMYCHRIGRTGRQEEIGKSYSLITRNLAPLVKDLINLLTTCEQIIEPHLLELVGGEEMSVIEASSYF